MHKLSFYKVNLIYMILTFFFLAGSVGVYFMGSSGLLFGTELLLVLAPTILFAYLFRGDMTYKKFLRLNPVSLKTIILSILMPILLYPAVATISSFVMQFLPSIPKSLDDTAMLSGISTGILIIGVGLLPGLCEELLFRGFFLRGVEGKGKGFAVIYIAFLFGIFHFNPYNFIGPFMLGIMLGYLLITTDSVVPGMIAHATNNTLAIVLMQVLSDSKLEQLQKSLGLSNLSWGWQFFGGASIVVLSFLLFAIALKAFKRENQNRASYQSKQDRESFSLGDKLSFLFISIPLVIYEAILVLVLVFPNLM